MSAINFIDLAAQQARIRDKLDRAITQVLDEGAYIMGPQVKRFETDMAGFCGAKHVISCANGTDALQLGLLALGIGQGDAVFVPSFTFAATAEVVALAGATPVFVDSCADTFNMNLASLERAVAAAKQNQLRPCMVIPVDLFGLPAGIEAIERFAASEGLTVMCDSAQGFGGTIDGRMTGTFGQLTTTSFFPAKPLGCYGDGGAVMTDDPELARVLDSLRVHGKGLDKYDNVRIGMNSRLDTLQAAILIEKLAIYRDEITARQAVADRYSAGLEGVVEVPFVPENYRSVWAQYTIKLTGADERAALQDRLKAAGIPTAVYYPIPLHLQSAYRDAPRDPAGLPVAERLAGQVLSLPMHPYLEPQVQDRIIAEVIAAVKAAARADATV